MSFIDKLEKSIIGKIMKVENAKTIEEGIKAVQEGEITKNLKALENFDQPASQKLFARYINAVKENAKKESALLKESERLNVEGRVIIDGEEFIDLNK